MFRENPVGLMVGLTIALLIDYYLWGPLLGALFLGDAMQDVSETIRMFFWGLLMTIITLATVIGILAAIKKVTQHP